jgi:hypothetical protein
MEYFNNNLNTAPVLVLMVGEKRMDRGIFTLFIIILLATVAYYLALFVNTADRLRKWIVGQS